MQHFPDKLRLRTPKGLPRAIEVAAATRHTQPSEWARQALIRGLAHDGLTLLPDGQVGSTGGDRRSAGAADAGAAGVTQPVPNHGAMCEVR
jgi:hypothetical protein